MKPNFIRSFIFSSLAIVLYSCQESQSSESSKDEISVIPTTTVIRLDTTITQDYVTDIQAVKNVELRSRLNGFLEKIYVDEGDFVRKGQILFTLNAEEFRTELAKANAMLNNAIADAKKQVLKLIRPEYYCKKILFPKLKWIWQKRNYRLLNLK